jgi:hypothetical protein
MLICNSKLAGCVRDAGELKLRTINSCRRRQAAVDLWA